MKKFIYQNYPNFNPMFQYQNLPRSCNDCNFPNNQNCQNYNQTNNDRFGGFLVPFLAGAVVSAPFWYLGANNKAQQAYQQQMYYQQNQAYPMYYPYQSQGQTFPSYYPYPTIK